MYSVSERFKDYIKRKAVTFEWYGTITDLEGNTYDVDKHNIVQNSGKITRRCCSTALSVGTAFASSLRLSLYSDIDRYTLFGASVVLNFKLYEGVDENHEPVTESIPMGTFVISECNQSSGKLSFTALDYMTKFDDVPFSATLNNLILEPFAWLSTMCEACGVTLGMTRSQIEGLPNGNRPTGFADSVNSVSTWKDVLSYLGTYLNCFAYIGRDGSLYLGRYTSTFVDTIQVSTRFSSELSDYKTTYDGLYATYKDGGVKEYVSNNNSDGLILDIGTNPFLQFNIEVNRIAALQEIIDSWDGIYYVPYTSTIKLMPHYDLGDVLKFMGNQASDDDIGALTEIICGFGGKMSIVCAGGNPRLTKPQDRFTKVVAGLSADYNNGQEVGTKNFWLLHTENTGQLTVGSSWTQVAEIEFKQTTDVQRLGTVFSCEAVLSKTSTVEVRITIDDEEAYCYDIKEEKMMKGTRIVPSSKAFRVTDKGTHVAKVYMKVTDNPTLWGDLV